MLPLEQYDSNIVSEAIVVWTAWENSSWPRRSDERIIERFGDALGRTLCTEVRRLSHEFYESDANMRFADRGAMGRCAAARFRTLHPELTDPAVDALAWCYMYDNK
jgi:hypothetical protein